MLGVLLSLVEFIDYVDKKHQGLFPPVKSQTEISIYHAIEKITSNYWFSCGSTIKKWHKVDCYKHWMKFKGIIQDIQTNDMDIVEFGSNCIYGKYR